MAKNATFQEKYLVKSYKPNDSLESSQSISFVSFENFYTHFWKDLKSAKDKC